MVRCGAVQILSEAERRFVETEMERVLTQTDTKGSNQTKTTHANTRDRRGVLLSGGPTEGNPIPVVATARLLHPLSSAPFSQPAWVRAGQRGGERFRDERLTRRDHTDPHW